MYRPLQVCLRIEWGGLEAFLELATCSNRTTKLYSELSSVTKMVCLTGIYSLAILGMLFLPSLQFSSTNSFLEHLRLWSSSGTACCNTIGWKSLDGLPGYEKRAVMGVETASKVEKKT